MNIEMRNRFQISPALILIFTGLVLLYRYFPYLLIEEIPSVDLSGHIAVAERLLESLGNGNIIFYDTKWLGGYPAFLFYGFFPYLVLGILGLVTNISIVKLVTILLLIVVCLLPAALYYTTKPLFKSKNRILLNLAALSASIFTLWFTINNNDYYGVGVDSFFHTGLFSQSFAYLFYLIVIGSIFRVVNNESRINRVISIVFISLLIITHPLTSSYLYFLIAVLWIVYIEHRKTIFIIAITPIVITSPWSISFFKYKEYLYVQGAALSGDFFSIFFSYTLKNTVLNFYKFISGDYVRFDWNIVLVWILSIYLIIGKSLFKSKNSLILVLTTLISIGLFSSNFILDHIPVNLHFYRYNGLFFVNLLVVLTYSLARLLSIKSNNRALALLTRVPIYLILLLSVVSSFSLSSKGYSYMLKNESSLRYKYDNQVLDFLKKEEKTGSVSFEYFKDYNVFKTQSPHYLESKLYKETGFETLNGLFIQSSLKPLFHQYAWSKLGASTYNQGCFFCKKEVDTNDAIDIFNKLGVSYLVYFSDSITEQLEQKNLKIKKIGPYYIAKINESKNQRLKPVKKKLIAYLDKKKILPFFLLSTYFFQDKDLRDNFELIEVGSEEEIPEDISLIIVNGKLLNKKASQKALSLTLDLKYQFNHENLGKQTSMSSAKVYSSLFSFFEAVVRPPFVKIKGKNIADSQNESSVFWDVANQAFVLSNINTGKYYELDYSYFPTFSSENCHIYRGIAEKFIFKCDKKNAELKFN